MPWTEKLPSGKYRGSYRLPTGQIRSAGTFPHKRGALAAAATAEEEAHAPGWRDPKAGFRPWGQWLPDWTASRQVSPTTLKHESSMLNVHIVPRWEKVPLADVTRHDILTWANELAQELEPSSVRRVVAIFAASLSAAVGAQIIPTNPAYKLALPKGEIDPARYLTHEEADRLLAELPGLKDGAVARTMFGTGIRWGEMVGLQVQRISGDRTEMRVAETWSSARRVLLPYPKGKKIREVPIPVDVAAALEPFLAGRRTGLVFAHDGLTLDSNNWRNRTWNPATIAAGVEGTVIHDMRHTYASWLLQGGISLAQVGQLLGHMSQETTQIYAHLAPPDRTEILGALARRGASRGANDTE